MKSAHDQFLANIQRARDLVGLAANIDAQTTSILDASDLFRSALVLGVSALDHFVHELVRIGMLEIAQGLRPATPAYSRFSVRLGNIGAPAGFAWLDAEIRERHGWLSFQDPEKIADAVRHVSSVSLWEHIGDEVGILPTDAKARLRLIVDRRNKIAHEADMDPTAPGARWPVSHAMADDALDYLSCLAEAVLKGI